jgi:radical SAM superfamily enzyme YgiQ (UPF0313 family)
MSVILIKCPRSCRSHFEENSESLALAYLGAALRQKGEDAEILDASLYGLSLDDIVEAILGNRYDLIGFTIADPTFIKSTMAVINALRQKGIKSHITMGGHTPTFHYKEVLEMCPGLDSVVMYEGENTIVELTQALSRKHDWHRINSLAYRGNSGIKCNPTRPLISNLDSLPFPVRDTVPFLLQHKPDAGVVSIAGGRGCYMNCGFCSIRAFYTVPKGSPWRVRSNENIVDEMEHLVQTYDIKELLFVDDVFVGPGKKNKDRILELADEIEDRKLKVMFSIGETVHNIEEDLFKRLKAVGVRHVLLGIESGSQEILDYFNKGITIQEIQKAVEILKQLDIDIRVSFINFTPLTTIKQLKENVIFYLSLETNILQGLLNRLQPYGGTPLGEQLKQTGLVTGKFPNCSCILPDRKVNLTYEIARKSLGTFLATANELNKLERTLKIKTFDVETEGKTEEVDLLKMEKARYRQVMRKIMEEAAQILFDIVSFAETSDANNTKKIQRFTNDITETSLSTYREWLGLIEFFKRSSVAFDTLKLSNCYRSVQG